MSDGGFVSRAGRLPLVGGALALDFCNTTSGLGSGHCQEHLLEFEHLLLWTVHAGGITAADSEVLRALAEEDPAAARAALDRALELRRTLYSLFHALAHGEDPPTSALAGLNAALAASHRGQSLTRAAEGFAWRYPAVDGAPDGPLGPVARSAAHVLLSEPLDRLKQCPGHECGWLFLDRSKNGIRVWCEMEVCGSRAKARARAERRRSS
ncbi:MAG TPA: ABATE domain-containing protein [Aliidongia sp.]|uniref:CGNR zinc finger domain-containing protein n=1 Tax=Aliidongia sp. TaxID=1914230 RepID=UPI002DDCB833|nr:ABATE domain-containing protein [Aliidongia sp.]HEV2678045.1 ABATE domain-containing protein [Aliidongia sp.]